MARKWGKMAFLIVKMEAKKKKKVGENFFDIFKMAFFNSENENKIWGKWHF
jgi:hypothetical protein